ncbi:DUF928 domain-containing protein [Moorena producens JHB]|uniref:DUF928 domain-containing protein n=1 Tax=Moorena producens (strain JHB) TaxID=1454205 RepID=A0A1D9G5P3_MOOP1|nr:DUF928 domain-containing protein [Moorena producens]AOY82740.1 DUF928 domain-containing protein [Moorena producens JHB]
MMLTKLFRLKYLFPFNLVFVGWISCFLVSRVEANQSINVCQALPVPIKFIPPNCKPLDNPKAPPQSTFPSHHGTGSRGSCLDKPELPALYPLVGVNNLYSTVSDYPTFWIYLPYTSKDAPSLEFSLQDENGENDIYRQPLNLPDQPGIVGIRLPKTETQLGVGQTYAWNIKINCPTSASSNKSSTPLHITGTVRRVAQSPELEQDLNLAKNPLKRIRAYCKHDIWYDHFTDLAELKLEQPRDMTVKQGWTRLLEHRFPERGISKQPLLGILQDITPVLVKK